MRPTPSKVRKLRSLGRPDPAGTECLARGEIPNSARFALARRTPGPNRDRGGTSARSTAQSPNRPGAPGSWIRTSRIAWIAPLFDQMLEFVDHWLVEVVVRRFEKVVISTAPRRSVAQNCIASSLRRSERSDAIRGWTERSSLNFVIW
jgi:hypothetical protein